MVVYDDGAVVEGKAAGGIDHRNMSDDQTLRRGFRGGRSVKASSRRKDKDAEDSEATHKNSTEQIGRPRKLPAVLRRAYRNTRVPKGTEKTGGQIWDK